jgi:quercetin dioxygenase-like cupin family protein
VDYLRARDRGEDFDPSDADIYEVDETPADDGGTLVPSGDGTAFVVGTAASVFKATKDSTAGVFSLAEVTIEPGTSGPPPHLHLETLDSFYVLAGTLSVRLRDDEIDAPAGSYACVPPGVVHTFANRSDGRVRFLNLNSPGGWEDYIRDMAAAMPPGEPPDPHVMAAVAARYDIVFPDGS